MYEDGVTYGMAIQSLERETIGALVGAAHAEGLLAVIHVSTLAHGREAVALDADGLVHVWCDALVNDVQAARIAETGVFVVPTLSVVNGTVADGRAARGEVAMENERRLHVRWRTISSLGPTSPTQALRPTSLCTTSCSCWCAPG